MTGMYDQQFYDVIRAGAQQSARTAAPIIADLLGLDHAGRRHDTNEPIEILDVGCGEGWWADAFAQLGYMVTGIDSGHTEHRPDSFVFIDQSLDAALPDGYWDVIICLEVLEHVPDRLARTLLRQFRERADCVVISAARPGQGGTGHINEQPIGHWAGLLADAGYAVSGALRWHLWGNRHIENWYQQNLLVGIPKIVDADAAPVIGEGLFPPEIPEEMATPHDVVHPILFDARRN